MENNAIEKFMKSLKLECRILFDGEYRYRGYPLACFKCVVYEIETRKKHLEFYVCYAEKNGRLRVEDANQVVIPNEGLFAYFGDDKMVYEYFNFLMEEKAKEYFEEN